MIIKECKFEIFLIDSRCFRKGILLKLVNQDGREAITEISPLPGHSNETLDDAYGQLLSLKRRLLTTWWTKQSLHYLENLGLHPSVHFGVESALLDLLDPIQDGHCDSYSLLLGTPDEIPLRAEEVKKEGFGHVKIKLGHFTPAIAKEIVDSIDKTLKIRIDLNRKWSLDETLSLCKDYPHDFFEYIEEPCSNPEDVFQFPYAFALDETLRDHHNLANFVELENLKAFIIKPTMTYPLKDFLSLGKRIVLTSSFEGPVGISQIRRFISRLGLNNTKHGLDTLRYFETVVEHDHMSDRLLAKASF